MSSKTKIVVLHMKEIIYTIAFISLGLLLVFLFLIMFRPKKDTVPTASDVVSYIPGVYTEVVNLGNQEVNIEVCVDSRAITSITMSTLDSSVETMYPLVRPALDSLSAQICNSQTTDGLTCPDNMKYTSEYLKAAIQKALHKASVH